MTNHPFDVAFEHIAQAHRDAAELRAGRLIATERRRARRARKVAELRAAATRMRLLVPSSDWQ